jgi:uncharacterized UBP type Zn finger protein
MLSTIIAQPAAEHQPSHAWRRMSPMNAGSDTRATAVCNHLDEIRDVQPSSDGCEDCRRIGARWVHLRMCMTCGHVGCCDSSPNRHATLHFGGTGHPVVRSQEPGEAWMWCYVDELVLMPAQVVTDTRRP